MVNFHAHELDLYGVDDPELRRLMEERAVIDKRIEATRQRIAKGAAWAAIIGASTALADELRAYWLADPDMQPGDHSPAARLVAAVGECRRLGMLEAWELSGGAEKGGAWADLRSGVPHVPGMKGE